MYCDGVQCPLEFMVPVAIELQIKVVLFEILEMQFSDAGPKAPFERTPGRLIKVESGCFIDQIAKPEKCGLAHGSRNGVTKPWREVFVGRICRHWSECSVRRGKAEDRVCFLNRSKALQVPLM